MSSWVPLMRAVHRWELDRITHEENRLCDMTLSVTAGFCFQYALRTVLLNTQSRFPSSVYSFIPHPWTSREVSAEPLSGPTVETRSRTSVFLPMVFRKLADVMSVQSWVHSKEPYPLDELAWGRYTEISRCFRYALTRLLWRVPLCL